MWRAARAGSDPAARGHRRTIGRKARTAATGQVRAAARRLATDSTRWRTPMDVLKKHGLKLPVMFISFVFIQSLFFKFSRHPETVHIFEAKLDPWAAGLGFPGLFAPGGLFSAYTVGTMELIASVALLFGSFVAGRQLFQGLGALLALGVISGAIFFHLFTPLGIEVINADGSADGGQLFSMACLVWLSAAVIVLARRAELLAVLGGRR